MSNGTLMNIARKILMSFKFNDEIRTLSYPWAILHANLLHNINWLDSIESSPYFKVFGVPYDTKRLLAFGELVIYKKQKTRNKLDPKGRMAYWAGKFGYDSNILLDVDTKAIV
ncbi:hypothetical protein DASC09_063110 [Saccharomycopsis crataegensis]|uniref:Uncharacterized protein n=1 Tax=Saccharomycopsis crataegensis TaxID=43959 RepID=A0AAV5QWN6_9ASCO|nr:hypothetical protein DASC09_063110 [Saccharomycopsis crataegensis]